MEIRTIGDKLGIEVARTALLVHTWIRPQGREGRSEVLMLPVGFSPPWAHEEGVVCWETIKGHVMHSREQVGDVVSNALYSPRYDN